MTPDGIVLIYNGADDKLVYRTGVAVFDRKDPRKLIWRSEEPVFSPEKDWEKVGQVPNVVFVEGMVRRGDRYLFYYGGADTYVGVAEAGVTPLNCRSLDPWPRRLLPSIGLMRIQHLFLSAELRLFNFCSRFHPACRLRMLPGSSESRRARRSDRDIHRHR